VLEVLVLLMEIGLPLLEPLLSGDWKPSWPAVPLARGLEGLFDPLPGLGEDKVFGTVMLSAARLRVVVAPSPLATTRVTPAASTIGAPVEASFPHFFVMWL